MNELKKQKLIQQILKFGVVGGISFLIDYLVYTSIVVVFLGQVENRHLIAAPLGFTVSLLFNYYASMKFVYTRKENADRRVEFTVFLLLSLAGLLINQFLIWLFVNIIYRGIPLLMERIDENAAMMLAKVGATGFVMVYNFITRKIFLEKKEA